MRPNDEIFEKGYAFFRGGKRTNRNEINILPAPNGFYEGLAQLPVSQLLKKRRGLKLTKAMRIEIELIQAREAQIEAAERMRKVKTNMQEAGFRESDF